MKILPAILFSLALAISAHAEQMLREFDWTTPLPSGAKLVQVDGRTALEIDNTNDLPLQVSLLSIPKPGIHAPEYALRGEIKYDEVHGDGYLEMWNYFPPTNAGLPEGQYFSRTLGDSGEMGKITGTSDWRQFALPFDAPVAAGSPTRLQINLVLKGGGKVYLRPMKLVQYPSPDVASFPPRKWRWFFGTSAHPWWSNGAGGIVGAFDGVICGCLGALIGILGGRGKARGLVLALFKIQIAAGALALIGGIIALANGQSFAVWYPLLLTGILLIAIYASMLPKMTRQYQELELRRMHSMDVAR